MAGCVRCVQACSTSTHRIRCTTFGQWLTDICPSGSCSKRFGPLCTGICRLHSCHRLPALRQTGPCLRYNFDKRSLAIASMSPHHTTSSSPISLPRRSHRRIRYTLWHLWQPLCDPRPYCRWRLGFVSVSRKDSNMFLTQHILVQGGSISRLVLTNPSIPLL